VPFAQSVLDLIAGQDYPNLEVLFIDDGKPGTLVSVLREHYDIEVHSQIEGGEPMMYKAIKPHLGANNLSVVVLELGHQSSLSIGAKRYAAAQRARGSVSSTGMTTTCTRLRGCDSKWSRSSRARRS
jgi:glycosyltransferase involved in cell wall biosynthesis